MEALFHLLFEIVKIWILAGIYALILLGLFRLIGKSKPESWFHKVTANKKKFWFSTGISISIFLFIWLFSYWGNHGLGDFARIPIGNGYAVKNINWTAYGYLKKIETSEGKRLEMTKFEMKDNKLIGNLDSWFYIYSNQYFILDLKTDELIEFENKVAFDEFATKNNLSKSEELKSFRSNYLEYWNGWRFWLLP